ncbi:MAG: DinB family protein [Caldilineales bacterium]
MKEQLASLFDYGDWVTERLLDTAGALTAEQIMRPVLAGFGSVHLTLVHLLGAEVLWFARWQSQSPATMLSANDLPDLPAIRARWAALATERRAWFVHTDDAGLAAQVNWTNMRGRPYMLACWQVVLHCANHSTHHRSEVAAMLTELGHEPPATDLLAFYLEQSGEQWQPTGRS